MPNPGDTPLEEGNFNPEFIIDDSGSGIPIPQPGGGGSVTPAAIIAATEDSATVTRDIGPGGNVAFTAVGAAGFASIDLNNLSPTGETHFSKFSGDYDDLTDKPTLGTAAAKDVGAFVQTTPYANDQTVASRLLLQNNIILEDPGAGANAKILARDGDDNSTHELLGLNDYGVNQKQVEVGSPKAPICFNYAMVAAWATDIHPKLTYKDLGGTSHDEQAAFVSEVTALAERVDAIAVGGVVVATSNTKALMPTNLSGLPAGTIVGDRVVVLADESQAGARTEYYITAIAPDGTLTYLFGGSLEHDVNDIAISSFVGSSLSSTIPQDGKPYEVYWGSLVTGAPGSLQGIGIAMALTGVAYFFAVSNGVAYTGEVATISSATPTWKPLYSKPAAGIPKTDLDASVQASLDLADQAQPELMTEDGTRFLLRNEQVMEQKGAPMRPIWTDLVPLGFNKANISRSYVMAAGDYMPTTTGSDIYLVNFTGQNAGMILMSAFNAAAGLAYVAFVTNAAQNPDWKPVNLLSKEDGTALLAPGTKVMEHKAAPASLSWDDLDAAGLTTADISRSFIVLGDNTTPTNLQGAWEVTSTCYDIGTENIVILFAVLADKAYYGMCFSGETEPSWTPVGFQTKDRPYSYTWAAFVAFGLQGATTMWVWSDINQATLPNRTEQFLIIGAGVSGNTAVQLTAIGDTGVVYKGICNSTTDTTTRWVRSPVGLKNEAGTANLAHDTRVMEHLTPPPAALNWANFVTMGINVPEMGRVWYADSTVVANLPGIPQEATGTKWVVVATGVSATEVSLLATSYDGEAYSGTCATGNTIPVWKLIGLKKKSKPTAYTYAAATVFLRNIDDQWVWYDENKATLPTPNDSYVVIGVRSATDTIRFTAVSLEGKVYSAGVTNLQTNPLWVSNDQTPLTVSTPSTPNVANQEMWSKVAEITVGAFSKGKLQTTYNFKARIGISGNDILKGCTADLSLVIAAANATTGALGCMLYSTWPDHWSPEYGFGFTISGRVISIYAHQWTNNTVYAKYNFEFPRPIGDDTSINPASAILNIATVTTPVWEYYAYSSTAADRAPAGWNPFSVTETASYDRKMGVLQLRRPSIAAINWYINDTAYAGFLESLSYGCTITGPGKYTAGEQFLDMTFFAANYSAGDFTIPEHSLRNLTTQGFRLTLAYGSSAAGQETIKSSRVWIGDCNFGSGGFYLQNWGTMPQVDISRNTIANTCVVYNYRTMGIPTIQQNTFVGAATISLRNMPNYEATMGAPSINYNKGLRGTSDVINYGTMGNITINSNQILAGTFNVQNMGSSSMGTVVARYNQGKNTVFRVDMAADFGHDTQPAGLPGPVSCGAVTIEYNDFQHVLIKANRRSGRPQTLGAVSVQRNNLTQNGVQVDLGPMIGYTSTNPAYAADSPILNCVLGNASNQARGYLEVGDMIAIGFASNTIDVYEVIDFDATTITLDRNISTTAATSTAAFWNLSRHDNAGTVSSPNVTVSYNTFNGTPLQVNNMGGSTGNFAAASAINSYPYMPQFGLTDGPLVGGSVLPITVTVGAQTIQYNKDVSNFNLRYFNRITDKPEAASLWKLTTYAGINVSGNEVMAASDINLGGIQGTTMIVGANKFVLAMIITIGENIDSTTANFLQPGLANFSSYIQLNGNSITNADFALQSGGTTMGPLATTQLLISDCAGARIQLNRVAVNKGNTNNSFNFEDNFCDITLNAGCVATTGVACHYNLNKNYGVVRFNAVGNLGQNCSTNVISVTEGRVQFIGRNDFIGAAKPIAFAGIGQIKPQFPQLSQVASVAKNYLKLGEVSIADPVNGTSGNNPLILSGSLVIEPTAWNQRLKPTVIELDVAIRPNLTKNDVINTAQIHGSISEGVYFQDAEIGIATDGSIYLAGTNTTNQAHVIRMDVFGFSNTATWAGNAPTVPAGYEAIKSLFKPVG